MYSVCPITNVIVITIPSTYINVAVPPDRPSPSRFGNEPSSEDEERFHACLPFRLRHFGVNRLERVPSVRLSFRLQAAVREVAVLCRQVARGGCASGRRRREGERRHREVVRPADDSRRQRFQADLRAGGRTRQGDVDRQDGGNEGGVP